MNYFLGLIYLLLFLAFCKKTGEVIIKKIGLGNAYTSKSVFCGFMYLSVVQFLIAFPSQLFHVSWKIYFWIMIIIYGIHLYYIVKHRDTKKFHQGISKIKNHLKSYWLLYLIAAFFTIMSISSQFPYFELNYDDSYYLGAIVQEMQSPALGTVNYFNGMDAGLDVTRVLNTVGLQYAFWSALFHVEPVAFVRFAVVLQNYILVFYVYHMLFTEIRKTGHNSQYFLIPFIILLIPAGYLHASGIVSMYDDWQLNTAIWYGSSLVRLCALPTLLIFAKMVVDSFNMRKLCWMFMLIIGFFSFSSIVLPIVIFTFAVGTFTYIWKRCKEKNHGIYYFIFFVLCIGLLIYIIPEYLYQNLPNLKNSMDSALIGYRKYANIYLHTSIVFSICLPIFLIFTILRKEKQLYWYFSIIILGMVLLLSGVFDKFVALICMNYNFVGLRFTTSLQYMILALSGMAVLSFFKNERIQIYFAIITLFLVNVFNYLHLPVYRSLYSYEASGLSIFGFSPQRVIKNPHIMPKLLLEIGDYFSSFEKKQRVLAPTTISCENAQLRLSESLVFSSRNLEIYSEDGNLNYERDVEIKEDRENMKAFADGTYREDIEPLLAKYKIDYILSDNPSLGVQFQWNADKITNGKDVLYIYDVQGL